MSCQYGERLAHISKSVAKWKANGLFWYANHSTIIIGSSINIKINLSNKRPLEFLFNSFVRTSPYFNYISINGNILCSFEQCNYIPSFLQKGKMIGEAYVALSPIHIIRNIYLTLIVTNCHKKPHCQIIFHLLWLKITKHKNRTKHKTL